MSYTLGKLLPIAFLACLLVASMIHAQNVGAAKPGEPDSSLDFSKDPCGNPFMESQLWQSVPGKVSKVLDGHSIVFAASEYPQTVRVRLTGIVFERHNAFSKKARERLQELLLNKSVDIFVKPGKLDKRPEEVTGEIFLREGPPSDVGLVLLSEGLVRFKEPRPYTMPSYTKCQYRRAEAEARSKKLGVWQ